MDMLSLSKQKVKTLQLKEVSRRASVKVEGWQHVCEIFIK